MVCPLPYALLPPSVNFSGPLGVPALWEGILCSPRLPGKSICLEARKSTAGSWESEGVASPPVQGGGDGEGWMTWLLLVWEIQYLLAEEVFWLVEKPGLMWPQGSELEEAETALTGSRAEQSFFLWEFLTLFEPRT